MIRISELIKKGHGISLDSRTIKAGAVFFAVNSGVNFVEEAFTKGAVAAVVPVDCSNTRQNIIHVPDVLTTLLDIGREMKLASRAKIIGITGSAGKTTTKVWLSEILAHRNKVVTGIKNYNTIYGLPICLSQLTPNDDFGIFEMGSNNSGEILELSTYLNPDIGVITNIMDSHIGRFGSKDALAREKISVINGIKSAGKIIFDEDSEYANQIIAQAVKRGVFPIGYRSADKNPSNIIKACIKAVIESLELNIDDYIDYMHNLKPLPGRGELTNVSYHDKNFTIIDDSYNAAPSTVKASLKSLYNLKGYNRKIAVLGEMKELGVFTLKYHEEIAEYATTSDKVFFIGSSEAAQPFIERGMSVFPKITNEITERILSEVENGDIVLIKGSHSIQLDKIVRFFDI